MKHAALYLRVSTEEQKIHGQSIDAQLDTLTKYCDSHGMTYEIYNDAGISARKSYKKRPELLRLLRDCQRGKIDVVLFTRLDRFFRSVPDYYECIRQMNGVPWKATLEDYEILTPEGVFKTNIMLSVAQSEADKTAARLRDSYQYRKARGEWYGRPPIGYILKDKKLEKDPETAPCVSAMFSTYLSTFSTQMTLQKAAEYGFATSRPNLAKILRNPVYSGTAYNGHRCEPYITPEQNALICSVKNSRKVKATDPDRVYLFSGVLVCGKCGKRLGGHFSEGRYFRYNCMNYCVDISEKKLERILLTQMDDILHTRRLEASMRHKGMTEHLRQKKRLEGKLERLKDLYINGDVDRNEYQKRKVEIEKEIAGIPMETEEVPELPKEWKEMYRDLTRKNRQVFWKKLIRQITITNETKEKPDIIFN